LIWEETLLYDFVDIAFGAIDRNLGHDGLSSRDRPLAAAANARHSSEVGRAASRGPQAGRFSGNQANAARRPIRAVRLDAAQSLTRMGSIRFISIAVSSISTLRSSRRTDRRGLIS